MAKDEQNYVPVASDEPVYDTELDSFELLWAKHKSAILLGALALVVVLVGVFGWLYMSHSARVAAESAFAQAKTADEFRAVIADHGGSVVAGNAALLLAQLERNEGNLDAANTTLRTFISAQPEHPLVSLAQIALGENEAMGDDAKAAMTTLQSAADMAPGAFTAPVAMMLKAELAQSIGDRNEALRTFQRMESQYPDSVATESSMASYQALEAIARPARAAAETETESDAAAGAVEAPASTETP